MKIFLGGKVSRNEFRTIERDVRVAAARFDAEICAVESLETVSVRLSNVDFFVLCRSFPTEFFPADVERLRRAAPLAPIALIAGALCEGENRTGATFPGTRRFYVGSWRESGRREFFRFFAESRGLFATASTATNVDYLAAPPVKNGAKSPFFLSFRPPTSRQTFDVSSNESKIAIFSDYDPAFGRFLRELFVERGVDARIETISRRDWFASVSSDVDDVATKFTPDRIVVDSLDLASKMFSPYFRSIRQKYPSPPIDLTAFAPRSDEIDFFENVDVWGRVCVLAKPFDVDFLLTAPSKRALYVK